MAIGSTSVGLTLAKAGAVVFALGVGGFLVLRAQREATPERPAPAPSPPLDSGAPASNSEPAIEASIGVSETPTYLSSSKFLGPGTPLGDPATWAALTLDSAYLFGSKSGVFVDSSALTPASPTEALPALPEAPVYMGSSKSLAPMPRTTPLPQPKSP